MTYDSSINFHSEDLEFTIENEETEIQWITNAILKENRDCGAINFIFCSDQYLHKMNLEYLAHDTLTDIITFNYNENRIISGDIYISIERVRENAVQIEQTFENELQRVMIHGILHLIGYDDKSAESQETMRSKEDYYLTLHP